MAILALPAGRRMEHGLRLPDVCHADVGALAACGVWLFVCRGLVEFHCYICRISRIQMVRLHDAGQLSSRVAALLCGLRRGGAARPATAADGGKCPDLLLPHFARRQGGPCDALSVHGAVSAQHFSDRALHRRSHPDDRNRDLQLLRTQAFFISAARDRQQGNEPDRSTKLGTRLTNHAASDSTEDTTAAQPKLHRLSGLS